jgi:hypothetical protein
MIEISLRISPPRKVTSPSHIFNACYVLWHYRSYAVRPVGNLREEAASPYPRAHTIGVRTHQLVEMLYDMTQDSQILGNNGSTVVFKLSDKHF